MDESCLSIGRVKEFSWDQEMLKNNKSTGIFFIINEGVNSTILKQNIVFPFWFREISELQVDVFSVCSYDVGTLWLNMYVRETHLTLVRTLVLYISGWFHSKYACIHSLTCVWWIRCMHGVGLCGFQSVRVWLH